MLDRNIPVWVPIAAVLTVGAMLGGLGSLFTMLGKEGTMVIGVGLTVFVPIIGWVLTRNNKTPSH